MSWVKERMHGKSDDYPCGYGAIHTPSMSPHLPVTPQQVAQQRLKPQKQVQLSFTFMLVTQKRPTDQSPEAFAPILQVVKQSTDAVVNITTGGAPMGGSGTCASCRTIQARSLIEYGIDEFRALPDA